MIEWTPSAKEELDRYVSRVRGRLEASGADAAEVVEDLKRHIDEEAAAARLSAVTEEKVRGILARMGTDGTEGGSWVGLVQEARPQSGRVGEGGRQNSRPVFFFLIAGMLLPLLAIGIELGTRVCASLFFDPLPTVWHTALALFVPLVNGWYWVQARRDGPDLPGLGLAVALSVSLPVCLFYALAFLPLVPSSFVGVIALGLGLLPLSVYFTLFAVIAAILRVRARLSPRSIRPLLLAGLAIGGAAIALVHLPVAWTKHALRLAGSSSLAESTTGIKRLRQWTHEPTLLRACYGRPRLGWDVDVFSNLLGAPGPMGTDDARIVFYRVTGREFNSVPPPKIFTAQGVWTRWADDFNWEPEQGGEKVAGRVRGLELSQSRQDAIIDGKRATSYFEWIIEFTNRSGQPREARAQILLPPGGVVSRLTLWIHGEEREAAFGGRAQTREAYQAVVQASEDPVLVTTAGPGQVLLQCFPVPASESMKVRVGITAPLVLIALNEGYLQFPVIIERNFSFPPELRHSVWVDSSSEISAINASLQSQTKEGRFTLRGEVPGPGRPVIRVNRDRAAVESWSEDSRARQRIHQRIGEVAAGPPGRVVLVIDGSGTMQSALQEIAAAFQALPEGIEMAVLLADDDGTEFPGGLQKLNSSTITEWSRRLSGTAVSGGQDNSAALARAWELAAQSAGGTVVWIHGSQPVLTGSFQAFKQQFDRRPAEATLYDVAVHDRPNRILENLADRADIVAWPRLGTLEADLSRLFESWHPEARRVHVQRDSAPLPAEAAGQTPAHLSHVARLWALEKIRSLIASRDLAEAVRLSAQYQLVTAVSGAVVLETQAQFARAELNPAPSNSVPVIPEPGTWALALVGVLLFSARFLRQRS